MEAAVQMKFYGKIGVGAVLLIGTCVVEAAEIEIEGLEGRSEAEIFALMGDRLEYVREKKASLSRAYDAVFLMEQILEGDGHKGVKVEAKVVSSDLIRLIVDEGQRLTLGNVNIIGDGDPERLAEIYAQPATSSVGFGGGSPPFRDEDVETGLGFVVAELKSQGYWDAEAVLKEQRTNKETGEVDVDVRVKQGKRFKIGRASVKSPDGRGLKRVATTAEPFIGQWATTEQVNKLRGAMLEAFTSRGYPDVKILMGRRLVGSTYYPEFEIVLGVRVRLRNVTTEGLKKTRPERLRRMIEPLEGEWYDEAAMNEKVKELLGTGAFKSVSAEKVVVGDKVIDANLKFEEAKAREISFSGGFGTFYGPLLRSVYRDNNFRGNLESFSVGLELSGRGALGEIRLIDPWWFETDISRTYRLFSLINAYDGYSTIESGAEISLNYEVTDHYSMDLALTYSYSVVTEDGIPLRLLGEESYNHLRLKFEQSFDYRDSPILPKSGWHLDIPIVLGTVAGEETIGYSSFGLDGGFYYPLGKTYQFGIGGFANYIMSSEEILDLPVDLRAFNGGARSVRSFPERELGPSFDGDPYGGQFSWAVNTELSRKINSSVSLVGFVDVGAVDGTYEGRREGGVEIAAGLGVRIDLPIGPVRLEYGHNLTQDDAEPSGTWHFAIGATF